MKIMKEKAIQEKKMDKYKEQIVRAFSTVLARKIASRSMIHNHNDDLYNENAASTTPILRSTDSINANYQSPAANPINPEQAPANNPAAAKFFGMWKARALETEEPGHEHKKEEVSFAKNIEKDISDEEKDDSEEEENEENLTIFDKLKIFGKAIFWMGVGVVIVIVFSDPMVDSIANLGLLFLLFSYFYDFEMLNFICRCYSWCCSFLFVFYFDSNCIKRIRDNLFFDFCCKEKEKEHCNHILSTLWRFSFLFFFVWNFLQKFKYILVSKQLAQWTTQCVLLFSQGWSSSKDFHGIIVLKFFASCLHFIL